MAVKKKQSPETEESVLELSKIGLGIRGSLRIKLGKVERTPRAKEISDKLISAFNFIRKWSFPDLGFSLDMLETKIISNDVKEELLIAIKDIDENNSIGLDILYSSNAPKLILDYIEEINKSLVGNSVKLRKIDQVINTSVDLPKYFWYLPLLGFATAIVGHFLRTSTIAGKGISVESNIIQIFGIALAFGPFFYKYLISKQRNKNQGVNSNENNTGFN